MKYRLGASEGLPPSTEVAVESLVGSPQSLDSGGRFMYLAKFSRFGNLECASLQGPRSRKQFWEVFFHDWCYAYLLLSFFKHSGGSGSR